MSRIHIMTHPILGAVSFREMQRVADERRKDTGEKICVWCHKPVCLGRRTRCGDPDCDERLWQSYSWSRCQRMCLRRDHYKCQVCRKPADEVDHIKPVCLGGTGDPDNLRALCRDCHKAATNKLRVKKERYVA